MAAIHENRAHNHRKNLKKVTFIGITGSCGKTTTKNLIHGLLEPYLRGIKSSDDSNCGSALINNILKVQPDHKYCIQELGAWGSGTLDSGLKLVKPHIGVVLNIRNDHYSKFRGLNNTQAEKSKIVKCLPSDGTAVLNADDPLVWEMRKLTSASILSFGTNQDADLVVQSANSSWPDRLVFQFSFQGKTYVVRTQLIGEHMLGSALAALAVAIKMGVSIRSAISRLATLPPTERRMSAVFLDDGINFIRDDFKATNDSMPEFLCVLSQARVARKIAVVGRISDHPGRSRHVYTEFALAAINIVDILIFVGERAESLWGRLRRNNPDFLAELNSARAEVQLFETVYEASCFLRGILQKGDLVVLKGSGVADHLERVLLQFQTKVQCWRSDCQLTIACDECRFLSHSNDNFSTTNNS